MHRLWLSCIVVVAAFLATVASAGGAPVVDSVRFRSITVEHGLSQATVRALLQDRRGFVWMGTLDGLNRSDGVRIRTFRALATQPDSLSDNHIWTLVEDREGGIWVGTAAGGVNRFDPQSERFERFPHGSDEPGALAGDAVTAMAVDGQGRVWLATSAGVLQYIVPGQRHFVRVRDATELPGLNATRDLQFRRDGHLLVATRSGLYELDGEGVLLRSWLDERGEAPDCYSVSEGPDGSLWLGSGDAGLLHWPAADAAPRRLQRADGLVSDTVRALQFDRAGRLWIGTLNGLGRLDPQRGEFLSWHYDPYGRTGLGAHRIESMMLDRDGLLWVGTWANGVSLHDPLATGFRLAPFRPGDPRFLPRPTATALAAAAGGKLWVGLNEEGGLVRLDPRAGVDTHWLHEPGDPRSLGASSVQAVLETRDGSLWVGSQTAGLSLLRGGADRFQRFVPNADDPASLRARNVSSLFEDRDGRVWVATIGAGVARTCPTCAGFESFEQISGGQRLPLQFVNLTRQTRDGALWFGLRAGGLVRFDAATQTLTPYRADGGAGSLSSSLVTHLYEDAEGQLWVGTQGGGLNRGRRGPDGRYGFIALRRDGGLAADAIASILPDGAGHLWVAHTVGITRVRIADLAIVNYGAAEGAQGRGYFVGSAAITAAGELAFGGLEGVTIFDPRAVAEPRPPKAPIVAALRVLGPSRSRDHDPESAERRPERDGERVLLRHDDTVLQADFSALNFIDAASTRYAYQLDGLDERWIALAAGTASTSFTSLRPGDYRLRLRATGPFGDRWIESQDALQLRVLPAPWWSWWAVTGYAAAMLLLGWLALGRLARYARQRLDEQRRLKQSEEWLSMALESSGDEIWDADLVGGSIVRRNPNPETVIPDRDRLGVQDIFAAVHPDDQQGFLDAYHAAVKGLSDRLKTSFRIATRNGGWLWALSYGRVVERDAQGRATRLIGVSRDISDIMQHEEALQRLNSELEHRVDARTRDLQGANAQLRRTLDELRLAQKQLVESEKMAALGGLVAGVAHEINTPLGIGVTAASHLSTESRRIQTLVADGSMKRSDLDGYLATAGDSSELILRNLKRADHLVKSFKQVAVDQSSEQRRVVDLAEYLDEILTSLHPRLKRTGHRVLVDCDASIRAHTYPGALYQVIVNLVMNSLVHGFENRENGTVRIIVRCVEGQIEVDFGDDGCGMSETVRTRIFEPFFTTKRGQGGSGLGMHIVYNLVTQMLGGTVDCESAPGHGVHFLLRFPQGDLEAID
ncbi:MAG: PAS domain-containing protein [Xanthomonadales bacterium]|nr:PAS domain-containing protein [Xanthomonadales bacterium]